MTDTNVGTMSIKAHVNVRYCGTPHNKNLILAVFWRYNPLVLHIDAMTKYKSAESGT